MSVLSHLVGEAFRRGETVANVKDMAFLELVVDPENFRPLLDGYVEQRHREYVLRLEQGAAQALEQQRREQARQAAGYSPKPPLGTPPAPPFDQRVPAVARLLKLGSFRVGHRTVGWGEATVDDFKMRREELSIKRDGIGRTIDFIEEAITALNATGANCLNEIVTEAA